MLLNKRVASKRRTALQLKCFILMPFKPDLDELYSKTLVPAVQTITGLSCVRADEIYGPTAIMGDIWRSIRESHFIIADLTGRNPNVLYELGLAHAVQKPAILLSQTIDDVPFDLRHLRVLLYKNTEAGRHQLQVELTNTAKVLVKETSGGVVNPKYLVLEQSAEANQFPHSSSRLLSSLKSKKPSQLVYILGKIAEKYEDDKRHTSYGPDVISQIRRLLQSDVLEVQAAAIRALGTAGTRIDAASLYPFLSTSNLALMESAVTSLGQLRDPYAAPRLIRMCSESAFEPYIGEILGTLGRIGTHQCIEYLVEIAHNVQKDETVRTAAIRGLSFSSEGSDVLLGLKMESLGVSARCELALALGQIISVGLTQRQDLENRIRNLTEHSSPKVRGHALAAWCLQSFSKFDGELDRGPFLQRLEASNQEELGEFFLVLNSNFRVAFADDEALLLAKLAEKFPLLLDDIVWILHELKSKSIVDFMMKVYTHSEDNRLWVLSYFSEVPFKGAATIQKRAIEEATDASMVCLAAVGLIRSGESDQLNALLESAEEASGWVKKIVRQCLIERVNIGSAKLKRRSIRALIKKLSD
jgi:hypothetical protein